MDAVPTRRRTIARRAGDQRRAAAFGAREKSGERIAETNMCAGPYAISRLHAICITLLAILCLLMPLSTCGIGDSRSDVNWYAGQPCPLRNAPDLPHDEFVILGLRQSRHGDGADHADPANVDRKRTAVRRIWIRIEPGIGIEALSARAEICADM